jgi:hypothetical protein
LFVSKKKLVFKPIRTQAAAFTLETAKIKSIEIAGDMGGFKLVKLQTTEGKIVFQIAFVGEGMHRNGNKTYAMPANNFLVKCLTDFDAAIAEFKRLTTRSEAEMTSIVKAGASNPS